MYVPYQLEEPWKCLYMVKPGSRDTQNKALEQSLWNKWLEFCTGTYYQCLKELFLRVTFTQQLPVNSSGLNTWLLDMKNIDFFFFNNRQSCPLKKKNRKIKRMKSWIVFLGHGKREAKDSKININMYTHHSDVVVKYMEFLLKCFADGKFPAGQWEKPECPSSLLYTIFRLILNRILANFVKFRL